MKEKGGQKEQGGLSMPDFDIIKNVIKATWIRRLKDANCSANWCHIPVSCSLH